MKIIYFVTSNQGKIDMFNQFLKEYSKNIKFEMLKLDFEELKQDDSLEKTALNKAKECLKLTKKENVLVSDVGLFIESLNGFPGVNTGFACRTIGEKGILKLMEGVKNRETIFKIAICYKDNKGREKTFSASSNIKIAKSIGGKEGFDWDYIVIGNNERFSDNIYNEKRLYPFKECMRQLVEFINNLD